MPLKRTLSVLCHIAGNLFFVIVFATMYFYCIVMPYENVYCCKCANLLTGQKSGFSPRRGDSFHRFMSNLAWPTGTWVRLAVQILPHSAQGGGNAAPKYETFPLFGKQSPRRGEPLDRFQKLLGFLYA